MRAWSGRQGAAALLVLAVTGVWRGLLLKGSYFNQDDYYLTTRAYHRSGLSWDFLFQAVAGHVQPAQQLCYWLVAHHAPFAWGRVAAAVLVVELLTVVVMWHLLSLLLPDRWERVPLLAVFAWSPITLVPTIWWSAAMGLWPPMLFLLLAALFFVRAQQRHGPVALDLALCAGAILLGLTWHERGILAIPVVVGLAVARSPRTGLRRLTDAWSRWWMLWVPIAGGILGYLVLHRTLTSVGAQHAGLGDRLDIARAFVLRNTLPGLASGPWQAHVYGGAIAPSRWVEVAAAGLVAVLVAVLIRRGGPGRWAALLMLTAYVAGDVLLLELGRSGFGEIIALDPRYTADVVAAAVLFAAVALEGGPEIRRTRWAPGITIAVAAAYLAGAAVTTAHLDPRFDNHRDRQFMTNLRDGLARNPDAVLLDRLAPAEILLPLLGKEALLSSVLAPLPEQPAFDLPGPDLRAVTDTGRLVAVQIIPIATAVPGHDGGCGHAVTAQETSIALTPSTPLSGRMLLHLEAFTDREADYQVRVGSWSSTVHVVRGPQDVWIVVPDDAGAFSSFSLQGAGPGTLCVVRVEAGPALPER